MFCWYLKQDLKQTPPFCDSCIQYSLFSKHQLFIKGRLEWVPSTYFGGHSHNNLCTTKKRNRKKVCHASNYLRLYQRCWVASLLMASEARSQSNWFKREGKLEALPRLQFLTFVLCSFLPPYFCVPGQIWPACFNCSYINTKAIDHHQIVFNSLLSCKKCLTIGIHE